MKRTLAAAAIAAPLLALAAPATAPAAALPPGAELNVWVDGSNIRGSLSLPEEEPGEIGNTYCTGPWIHTKASAERITNTLDLDTHPELWFIHQPDSIHGTDLIWTPGLEPHADIGPGDSIQTVVYLVPDGEYVAGIACADRVEGYGYTSLTLFPLTVGTPVGNSSSPPRLRIHRKLTPGTQQRGPDSIPVSGPPCTSSTSCGTDPTATCVGVGPAITPGHRAATISK